MKNQQVANRPGVVVVPGRTAGHSRRGPSDTRAASAGDSKRIAGITWGQQRQHEADAVDTETGRPAEEKPQVNGLLDVGARPGTVPVRRFGMLTPPSSRAACARSSTDRALDYG